MTERKPHPLVIGHRGAFDRAPENTLKGFKKAIELGADYIEFDLHESNDGALVIVHGVDILRKMGYNTTIEQMSLKELKKLNFGENETIPELWELIELAKGKVRLLCEIKAQGISEKVINLLRKEMLVDSTIIQSFNIEVLLEARKIEPSLTLAAIVPNNENYIPEWEERKKLIDKVIDLKFSIIVTRFKNLDALFLNYCHKNRLKVFVYTLNTKKNMKRYIKMGVDGIIVNSISKAKDVLKKSIFD
ncbi:MAG: glycerophosphodiester phosphodiesterase [Promethearchaeota archaeon]